MVPFEWENVLRWDLICFVAILMLMLWNENQKKKGKAVGDRGRASSARRTRSERIPRHLDLWNMTPFELTGKMYDPNREFHLFPYGVYNQPPGYSQVIPRFLWTFEWNETVTKYGSTLKHWGGPIQLWTKDGVGFVFNVSTENDANHTHEEMSLWYTDSRGFWMSPHDKEDQPLNPKS